MVPHTYLQVEPDTFGEQINFGNYTHYTNAASVEGLCFARTQTVQLGPGCLTVTYHSSSFWVFTVIAYERLRSHYYEVILSVFNVSS